MWSRSEDDFMEIGDSDLVPAREGFIDKSNGNFITSEGAVYDKDGEYLYNLDDRDEHREESE